jgi:predicted NAD/FAD-binding protein
MSSASFSLNIAVIGSGISGLSCAYRLGQAGHRVTLYEADDYFGGHTHTVDVTLGNVTYGVDTGFLVFNHQTYPNLVSLFDELNVETVPTEMTFSVKCALALRTLEWSGGNLDTVFAQRRNLFSPQFLSMLRDILRFNSQATELATTLDHADAQMSLGDFLERYRYGNAFRDWYLLPMAGCIWSCPTAQMLDFPVSTFAHFCHNHSLLQVANRPQWWTVKGGARHYVDKLLAGIADKRLNTAVSGITRIDNFDKKQVRVESSSGQDFFDHVVLATHSDQSLKLLKDASSSEEDILSAVSYQPNRAVLHTDSSCLPQEAKTWSAWNYQSSSGKEPQVCVHYLINKLQPLPFKESVIVSLNPIDAPDPAKIIAEYDYAHPVFDAAAIKAQGKLALLQGYRNTWYAGAWTGYGFHEDGLKSGLAVARAITQLGEKNA